MPIYAMDSHIGGNATNHINSNVNNSDGDHGQYHHISAFKTATHGKYKDIQEISFEIIQILEQIRLLHQENKQCT